MTEPTSAHDTRDVPHEAAGEADEQLAALADEFLRRHRAGERPSIDEYAAAHPQLAEQIRDVFAALIAMEQPGLAPALELATSAERLGTVIGRYKLLERIGEGGFGVVFMAEQQYPVRRKVALKVIKPGFDTRQVIARFEAERQALALMEHENIAKVLDAGATESGRPYFVMELVHGVPITEYCDKAQLPTRQRLELFMQVCRAVQHAHTKGIIHRDIKPTNVLVTLHEGVAVPKVIDFGVAKATGQQLTERTLFTQFAQMVGTPLYMSPEQAEMSASDVDTRTDVYSLGVLLYELLTGTTPFDKERLKQAAFDEVRRIIREEEPPRPSTRLTTLGEELRTISARRKSDPKRLGQVVRGELDWIVMKALDKDRNRRYETANGLARDVERYLRDESVEACPPSAAYRLRKFARRNKVALLVASTIVTSLLLLVGGLAISNRYIRLQRNAKEVALAQREIALEQARKNAAEAEAQRQRAEENFRKARIAIRDLLIAPAQGRGEWSQLPAPLRKKFIEQATTYYQSLLQQDSNDPSLRYETAVGQRSLGYLYGQSGDVKQAEQLLRQSIAILDGLSAESPANLDYRQQLAWSNYVLGQGLRQVHRDAEAETVGQRAIDLYDKLLAERPNSLDYTNEAVIANFWMGGWLMRVGRVSDAERSLLRAIEINEKGVASVPNEAITQVERAHAYYGLADIRQRAGRLQDAADLLKRGLKVDPDAHWGYYALATLQLANGDVEHYRGTCNEMLNRFEKQAATRHEMALRLVRACVLAPDAVPDFSRVDRLSERLSTGTDNIMLRRVGVLTKGLAEYRAGRYDQAVTTLKRYVPVPAGVHWDGIAFAGLAMAHHRLGHADEARAALATAQAIRARKDQRRDQGWIDWLHCEILCREAEQLLSKQ